MKEDEDDRRVMRITLTEASYKVIDKVNVAYEQCRQILTEGVSEEELQVFRRVIRQMNDNVNGELELLKFYMCWTLHRFMLVC